jgi:hypothetical protein
LVNVCASEAPRSSFGWAVAVPEIKLNLLESVGDHLVDATRVHCVADERNRVARTEVDEPDDRRAIDLGWVFRVLSQQLFDGRDGSSSDFGVRPRDCGNGVGD